MAYIFPCLSSEFFNGLLDLRCVISRDRSLTFIGSMSNYPETVSEIIDDAMTFRPSTLEALTHFKNNCPWHGTRERRKKKFYRLHRELCRIYGKETKLIFGVLDSSSSGSSTYCPATDTITLRGKLSVVTFLHEWGHALGKDEREACRWSVNLFKRVFPEQFARCLQQGHMLVKR